MWSEHGLGDAIQFVRFAAVLADRGGRVVVECPAPLAEVFATCPGVAAVVADARTQDPRPPHCHEGGVQFCGPNCPQDASDPPASGH